MEHDISLSSQDITLPESWKRLSLISGGVGLVALIAAFITGFGTKDFSFSYLTAYYYWLTIALGGLFFVLLHYLARSGWSVVVRRLAEHVMGSLPLFVLLFIPVALGMHDLYHWTHADAVAHDPLLQHKTPYLNEPFFFARAVFYFLIWTGLSVYFWRQSTKQDDTGDLEITKRLHKRSALGMVLFAITLTFAAFDWVMSLEPHWFSTIFGVYVFAGCVVSIFALLILLVLGLKSSGALSVVNWEHFHDMGKLLFGFVVFWAYIGFSQFMLIWYANIPEETYWFAMRWDDPTWRKISIFLAVGHFVVPFFFLITQWVKRNRVTLITAGIWMLFMHYVDMYWLVMPTKHHGEFHPNLMLDIACWLGIGGLFLGLVLHLMQKSSLVPTRDPRLGESLAFENP